MNNLLAIVLILSGIGLIYMTYTDGRNREKELTTGYIMHLKGYIGGVGLILIGLRMLYNEYYNL